MLAFTTLLLTTVISAGVFAGAAYIGLELSRLVAKSTKRPPDRPPAPEPPLSWFLGVAALLGAAIALRGMDWQGLVVAGLVSVSLAACWHSSVTYGRMPDYFTLLPLGAIVAGAIAQQNSLLLLGVFAPFIPFAAMAYLSKGKGMGWDDAKLAAFGGAILGMQDAVLAFAVACVVAVVVAWAQKRTTEPIAFAPYMIGAIALSLIKGTSA